MTKFWTKARVDALKSYYGDDWIGIAVARYLRDAERAGNKSPDQPGRNDCYRQGRIIYIKNGNGLLTKYRIRVHCKVVG